MCIHKFNHYLDRLCPSAVIADVGNLNSISNKILNVMKIEIDGRGLWKWYESFIRCLVAISAVIIM